ncbi:hypothetical protein E2C01_027694 [Portunus trituberculatus]|uniref:Uncharacterized protein n=1 Tax=Portunus trituberculatus TaxID=210409 RepID=A0A5B7EMB5_PORTR|nr:hypothetical protein [Portunus trituberculatus]
MEPRLSPVLDPIKACTKLEKLDFPSIILLMQSRMSMKTHQWEMPHITLFWYLPHLALSRMSATRAQPLTVALQPQQ